MSCVIDAIGTKMMTVTGTRLPRFGSEGLMDRFWRNDPLKLALAREMRRHPTPSEARAWELFRNRRCVGLKFRRQHVLLGFVVDFYCAERRLVLEVDGEIHSSEETKASDKDRTQCFAREGIQVVRIRNAEIRDDQLAQLLRPYTVGSPSPPCGEGARG